MAFQLKIDFTGLMAFVSDTKDPASATRWNAVLLDPKKGTGGHHHPQHFPVLVIPVENLLDDPPGNPPKYRTVPTHDGVVLIALPIKGKKVSFIPAHTGLTSRVDLIADLEKAATAGKVKNDVINPPSGTALNKSVAARVELTAGTLEGSQSKFMKGKTFKFTDDQPSTPYPGYNPPLGDGTSLKETRAEADVTVRLEALKGSKPTIDLRLQPINNELCLTVSNLPLESTLQTDYHRKHFKSYYNLSSTALSDTKRPMPKEDLGGAQTGKLVFCIEGRMYE